MEIKFFGPYIAYRFVVGDKEVYFINKIKIKELIYKELLFFLRIMGAKVSQFKRGKKDLYINLRNNLKQLFVHGKPVDLNKFINGNGKRINSNINVLEIQIVDQTNNNNNDNNNNRIMNSLKADEIISINNELYSKYYNKKIKKEKLESDNNNSENSNNSFGINSNNIIYNFSNSDNSVLNEMIKNENSNNFSFNNNSNNINYYDKINNSFRELNDMIKIENRIKKSIALENRIIENFDFKPIISKLKYDGELCDRITVEFIRFIIIKVLERDDDMVSKFHPSPLVEKFFNKVLIDTSKIKILSKIIRYNIQNNPYSIPADEAITEKRLRYEYTLKCLKKHFPSIELDNEIWIPPDELFFNANDEYVNKTPIQNSTNTSPISYSVLYNSNKPTTTTTTTTTTTASNLNEIKYNSNNFITHTHNNHIFNNHHNNNSYQNHFNNNNKILNSNNFNFNNNNIPLFPHSQHHQQHHQISPIQIPHPPPKLPQLPLQKHHQQSINFITNSDNNNSNNGNHSSNNKGLNKSNPIHYHYHSHLFTPLNNPIQTQNHHQNKSISFIDLTN